MGTQSSSPNINSLLVNDYRCKVCGKQFTGLAIKTLGGQVACSEECSKLLKPLYIKDYCYGCHNIVWEDDYIQVKDKYNFCSIICVSKFLSENEYFDELNNMKNNNRKVKSPTLSNRVLTMPITNDENALLKSYVGMGEKPVNDVVELDVKQDANQDVHYIDDTTKKLKVRKKSF